MKKVRVTDVPENRGMTLRDYFAGQALAGIWANKKHFPKCGFINGNGPRYCYDIADAMLAERAKKEAE